MTENQNGKVDPVASERTYSQRYSHEKKREWDKIFSNLKKGSCVVNRDDHSKMTNLYSVFQESQEEKTKRKADKGDYGHFHLS